MRHPAPSTTSLIARVWGGGINLVYPMRCASCRKKLDALDELGVCSFCIGNIRKNPKPYCVQCGRSLESAQSGPCSECRKNKFHFKRAYSACLHDGVVKEVVHAFKYRNKLYLSGILSDIMLKFIKENSEISEGVDAITFVPMRYWRLRARGFNQSKLLAHNVSRALGIPVLDSLKKTRMTKPQNELGRDKRLINLRGSIRAVNREKLPGLKMLLIDDVMATGSTLDESSKALLDSGAAEVRCLTLSRGI